MMTPVPAMLVITGWHGSTAYRVDIIGITPHRFRIRAFGPTRLAGRNRMLQSGEETLVPKTAIRVIGGPPFKHAAKETPGE